MHRRRPALVQLLLALVLTSAPGVLLVVPTAEAATVVNVRGAIVGAPTGEERQGMVVRALSQDGTAYGWTEDGSVTFGSVAYLAHLTPGTHRLCVDQSDLLALSCTEPFVVGADSVAGPPLEVRRPGELHVSATVDGNPANVDVRAFRMDDEAPVSEWDPVVDESTGADGQLSAPVWNPDDYRVVVRGAGDVQVHDVSVPSGGTAELAVDLPQRQGAISGQLNGVTTAVAGLEVRAYRVGGDDPRIPGAPAAGWTGASPAGNGSYTIGPLMPGTYHVCLHSTPDAAWSETCAGGSDVDSATDVVVGANGVTAPAMTPLARSQVTGTVVDGSNQPRSGLLVHAFAAGAGGLDETDPPTTTTAADGSWKLFLEPGSWVVRVEDPQGALGQRYSGGSATFAGASPFTVVRGQATATGQLQLLAGAMLTGTALPSTSDGRRDGNGLSVDVYEPGATTPLASTTSDATSGVWRVRGLAAGSYTVAFDRRADSPAWSAPQWWNGTPQGGTPALVTVTNGQVLTSIDAAPSTKGDTVVGRLVGPRGRPLESCRVTAVPDDPGLGSRSAFVDETGRFVVTGLAHGSYALMVDGAGATGYDNNAELRGCFAGTKYVDDTGAATIRNGALAAYTQSAPVLDVGVLRYDQQTDLPDLHSATGPKIVGSPVPGSTIQAPVALSPSGASVVTTWVDGTGAVLATGPGYQVAPADAGSWVHAEIVATLAGHDPWTARTPQVHVPVPVTMTTAPAITGTAAMGRTLTALRGTWSPTGPSFSYRWLVGSTTVQNGSTATLAISKAAWVGKRIGLVVTATAEGVSASSNQVLSPVVAPGKITFTSGPGISGTPRVGSTLRLRPEKATPSGLTRSLRWLRDGRAVAGATGSTYVVKRADRGHRLSLQVTYRKPGWVTVVKRTASTSRIS